MKLLRLVSAVCILALAAASMSACGNFTDEAPTETTEFVIQ